MIVSFAAFSIYLSVIYQQKQRRARENMLLVLKNQEIARRNEFIRYISATIGHEFKNNLGRIKRRIDLLPDLPRDVKERIDGNLDKLFADIDIFKKISALPSRQIHTKGTGMSWRSASSLRISCI